MELPLCEVCGRCWYYPTWVCPNCSAQLFRWTPVTGRGVVFSFTWVVRAAPGFEHMAPYVYALVELDEDVLMATNIIHVSAETLYIGLPVQVTYLDLTPGVSLPLFEPLRPEERGGSN
jgi:uncharacterized protein